MPENPNIFKPETWDRFSDDIKARLWALKEMLEPEQEFFSESDWGEPDGF